MKKVEGNMGFEKISLPDKHDCTLADLYSGHYNVCSISKETLSRPNVAIMVVLCCGPGGVSHGTVRKMGNTHLITALAIDCDPLSCATHELSHPHIPVVKYEMGEREGTHALIYRYVPKVLMSKTYIHVANSCRQAATGNISAVRQIFVSSGVFRHFFQNHAGRCRPATRSAVGKCGGV